MRTATRFAPAVRSVLTMTVWWPSDVRRRTSSTGTEAVAEANTVSRLANRIVERLPLGDSASVSTNSASGQRSLTFLR